MQSPHTSSNYKPTPLFQRIANGVTFGLIAILFYLSSSQAIAGYTNINGFDLSDTSIPAAQIMHGGPPRDGIPALTMPPFTTPKDADFLSSESRVIGVSINGKSKAYPIAILNYHEIVNDELGGQHIAVTFCPLCGTGIVYDAMVNNEHLEFGVSGLLYNSDVLLYDRQSESLWSQVLSTAISGSMKGTKLQRIPALHTTWNSWLAEHPNTRVLSQQTGHFREYRRTPYAGYNESSSLYFPVSSRDPRYHNKEVVITLELDGATKAYPFAELALFEKHTGKNHFDDTVADQNIRIEFNLEARSGRIYDSQNSEIPSFQAFWFAWVAFHPDTDVFTATQ